MGRSASLRKCWTDFNPECPLGEKPGGSADPSKGRKDVSKGGGLEQGVNRHQVKKKETRIKSTTNKEGRLLGEYKHA